MQGLNKKMLQEKLILNIIKDYEPISRMEIKKNTDIRLASITEITKSLIEDGIIKETGDDPENKNKRKKLLYINKERYYVIGADISTNQILVLLTDLKGNIYKKCVNEIKPDYPKQKIIDILNSMIKNIVSNYNKDKLLGIGISNPGRVDKGKGESVFSSQLEKWDKVPIKRLVSNEFGLPVFIGNSSETGIYAESWFGVAKNIKDVIYLHMGAGISIYIISNKRLINGYSGVVGELGHNIVVPNGKLCTCGNYGCLQTVASSKVIISNIVNILGKDASSIILDLTERDISKVSIDIITEAAEKNDKITLSILDEAGEYVGIALSNAINLLGSQLIIFGGEVLKNNTYIIDVIKRALKKNVLPAIFKDIVFKTASFPETECALGAIAMVMDEYFMYSKLNAIELLD